MEFTFFTVVLINLILLVGSLLQGLIGYGIGMFCAPLLFLINPSLVPAPLIFLSTIITIIMIYRDRSHLEFNQVSWAMVGGFFGVVLAGLILNIATKTQFELVFGALILTAVIISILGFIPKMNKKNSSIAGFMSGVMATITAVGGPPMALLYQGVDIKSIKANLSAFWLFLNIIALSTLALIGDVTLDTLFIVLMALPGTLIGLYVSTQIHTIIKAHLVRRWILALCAITSIIAIVRALG